MRIGRKHYHLCVRVAGGGIIHSPQHPSFKSIDEAYPNRERTTDEIRQCNRRECTPIDLLD